MIAHLSGTLAHRGIDHVVVDVGGVGFHLAVSLQTLAALPAVPGAARLFTYLHVREDALTLFGFASEDEREAFMLCLSVQGIGPKLAMSILSTVEPQELERAIAAQDHVRLTKIPGIGKKTAERIVLELKDKMKGRSAHAAARAGGAPVGGNEAAAVSALVNLGYRAPEAERAAREAKSANGSGTVEQILKEALRRLAE